MINIVTAIGSSELNEELKKSFEFNVLNSDIQYMDGIFEILEYNNKIDYIIISECIDGQYEIEELINKIYSYDRLLKIIIILNDKNIDLENRLVKMGIYDFFYNWTDITEIINFLKNKNIEYINLELRAEIENLKNIISKRNKNLFNYKLNKDKCNNQAQIIAIMGNSGIGKTTFAVSLANCISSKILVVDFNFENGDLSNFTNNFQNYDSADFSKLIIKQTDKLDILINLNILSNLGILKIDEFKFFLNSIKSKYDYIFLDYNNNLKNNNYYDLIDKIVYLTNIDRCSLIKFKNDLHLININKKINKNNLFIILYKYSFLLYLFNKKNINDEYFHNYNLVTKIRNKKMLNLFFNFFNNRLFKVYYSIIIHKKNIIKNILNN